MTLGGRNRIVLVHRRRRLLSPSLSSGPCYRLLAREEGLFVLIGAAPLTATISDWLCCDERGDIVAGPDLRDVQGQPRWPLERDPLHLEPSQPGVFVAGDVRHGSVKRVASAVGEGAMAASLVNSFLATD